MDADLAFDALADPVRREILAMLSRNEECSAGKIADQITSVKRTAVSAHLRVLRLAGLVAERKDGRFRYYSVDSSGSAREVLALLLGVFREGLADVDTAVRDAAETTESDQHTA